MKLSQFYAREHGTLNISQLSLPAQDRLFCKVPPVKKRRRVASSSYIAVCTIVVIQIPASSSYYFIRRAVVLLYYAREVAKGRSWIEISREFDVGSDHVAERELRGSATNLKF